MKKLLFIFAIVLIATTVSYGYQSTVTCGVTYYGYPSGGASASQVVTVQQDCDVVLEAETNTYGYAVAQLGSVYAYADTPYKRSAKMIINVSEGSTIYLSAFVAPNGSGWSYARAYFGLFHNPNLY